MRVQERQPDRNVDLETGNKRYDTQTETEAAREDTQTAPYAARAAEEGPTEVRLRGVAQRPQGRAWGAGLGGGESGRGLGRSATTPAGGKGGKGGGAGPGMEGVYRSQPRQVRFLRPGLGPKTGVEGTTAQNCGLAIC